LYKDLSYKLYDNEFKNILLLLLLLLRENKI